MDKMIEPANAQTIQLRRRSSERRLHPAHFDRSSGSPRLPAQDALDRALTDAPQRLYRVPSCPTLGALARPLYAHLREDVNRPKTQTNVLNLTHKAMSHYRVQPRQGRVYDAKDQLWDTQGRCAKFVMRPDGVLFAAVKGDLSKSRAKLAKAAGEKRTLHHSSFVRGPVAAAGLLSVRDGELLYAICESGHYEPTPQMMGQFLQLLRRHGFHLESLPVGFHLGQRGLCWFEGAYVLEHHDEEALTPERQLLEPVSFRRTSTARAIAAKTNFEPVPVVAI